VLAVLNSNSDAIAKYLSLNGMPVCGDGEISLIGEISPSLARGLATVSYAGAAEWPTMARLSHLKAQPRVGAPQRVGFWEGLVDACMSWLSAGRRLPSSGSEAVLVDS
jgi:hypothetical protein